MLTKIAIAGGTSPTLGRSIVNAINSHPSLTPIIISRLDPSKPQPQSSTIYSAPVQYVNYAEPSTIVSALAGVETVISVIKVPGPEWLTYQLNLLSAAQEAGVKRFAPSEFENGPEMLGKVDLLGLKCPVWQACVESGLEVTRFSNGMFMNYLALGKAGEWESEERQRELGAGFVDEPVIWDVKGRKAELPVKADGTFPVHTLTEIGDIGRFVAAACALPLGKWEPTMSMVGENIAVDKVTSLLEKQIGSKFEVTTVTADELKKRVEAVKGFGKDRNEIFGKMIAQIELGMLEEEKQGCLLEPAVNQLCPEVKAYEVGDYVRAVYGDQ